MKPLEVNVDGIMEDIGHLGKFQIKLFLWMFFPIMFCSMHDASYMFTTNDVIYRCKIPECDGINNAFNTSWLSNAIPEGDKCSRYARVNASSNNPQKETECTADSFDRNKMLGCHEYVFREENTFTEEMNITCESWKSALVGTIHSVGTLVALPFLGAFSDRVGRRYTLITSSIVTGIIGSIKALSVNYNMFIALEFLEPALGTGVYSSTLILGMEIVIPSMREAISVLITLYYAIGHLWLGFFAWAVPYWRTYLLVTYVPTLLICAYYWIISDSIKWLITKRRYQKAIDILTKIAAENNKTLSDKALESLKFNEQNKEKFDVDAVNEKGNGRKHISTLRLVVKSKILILRLLKVSLLGVASSFCAVGLSINSSSLLMYNRYENYIIASTIDIPANIISYFGLRYCGRKKTIITSFLIGGLALVSFVFIPKDLPSLSLVAYLLGKGSVSSAFGSLDLYVTELFPTPIRHSLFAIYCMICRLGSILAPQTSLLADYNEDLPTYLFAGSCLIAVALMLNSPETLNKRLPETVEDAENIV